MPRTVTLTPFRPPILVILHFHALGFNPSTIEYILKLL